MKEDKKKKSKTKVIGFRIPIDKEDSFRRRMKTTGKSTLELLEDGILINEDSKSEANILAKKRMAIAERNEYLEKAKDNNLKIEAYNRQLKNKSSRYLDLSVEDNVIDKLLLDDLIDKISWWLQEDKILKDLVEGYVKAKVKVVKFKDPKFYVMLKPSTNESFYYFIYLNLASIKTTL